MPYGLPNETPEITKKMDSCVQSMLDDSDFRKGQKPETRKASAIAICKTSIMKNMAEHKVTPEMLKGMTPEEMKKHMKDAGMTPEEMETMMKKMGKMSENHEFTFDIVELDSNDQSVIEVLRTGKWDGQKGKFRISETTLDNFVDNFHKNTYGTELQVNIAHNREGEAAGWIKELFRQGKKLLARVEWTSLGLKVLKDKVFRYISAELAFQFRDEEKDKEYKDVLIGAALTNVPYVRGLAPVQLSESLSRLFHNSFNMEAFKILLEELLEKKTVSASDVALLKKMYATLTEEDQVTLADEVKQVEVKAAEGEGGDGGDAAAADAEAAAKTAAEAEAKAKADADAAAAAAAGADEGGESKEPQLSEGKSYSAKEVQQFLSEQKKGFKGQIDSIRSLADKTAAALRTRDIAEKVGGLLLSEASYTGGKKKVIGLPPKLREKVQKFMESLSDSLQTTFIELIKSVNEVDFSEIGKGSGGKPGESGDDAKIERAKILAEEKGIDFRKALDLIESGKA